MIIAIHNSPDDFHPRWISYCKEQGIRYKLVNCYNNDIIDQLEECDALMWHFHQSKAKDILLAKQLMFSLQQADKKIFPDFNTAWHFDDKLGQKYLLEAIKGDLAPTWIFYEKSEALDWIKITSFPKVFKLRGGAGSQNVKLVNSEVVAKRLINKAFDRGFSNYNAWGSLKDRWQKYRLGKTNFYDVFKGMIRLVLKPQYAKVKGRETSYIYFQEFFANNDSDIRIVVVSNKAFALKRMVRENDFRASGSGTIKYEKEEIDIRCIKSAFDVTKELRAQCLAFDYVFDLNNDPKLIEISFGFHADSYDACVGYWDNEMNWHAGNFNPYGWMVEQMISKV